MTTLVKPASRPAFKPVKAGLSLSDQVSRQLAQHIRAGRHAPGEKLPSEASLTAQLGVSRTVVREAMSHLKSQGLVQARQGSGVYVALSQPFEPLNFDARLTQSKTALTDMMAVRRALEAEAAALAAQRCSTADKATIRATLKALNQAVKQGQDGVEEDLLFHRSIAQAAHNPFFLGTLDYLAQFTRRALRVTRANEARRADFTKEVRAEHAAMAAAVLAGDSTGARLAASAHLQGAVLRLETADPAFWTQLSATMGAKLAGNRRSMRPVQRPD
jgi:GntR family transcriptional regulator, transcriptional repressor for pyruvate dehydrogenase complex